MSARPHGHAALGLALALSCALGCRGDVTPPGNADAAEADPAPRPARGGASLRIDPDAQTSLGVEDAGLRATTYLQDVVAYGRVIEDPAASFAVRAPTAGVWQLSPGSPPLALGVRVARDADLGWVVPRMTPIERADVATRLATGRADLASARAASSASERELARAEILNRDDKNVSDRALEDARARSIADAARVEGLERTLTTLADLNSNARRDDLALRSPIDGDVFEIGARPGESVEAGAVLVRVVDGSRPLVRVDLPLALSTPLDVTSVEVLPAFDESLALSGHVVAESPAVDIGSQARGQIVQIDPAPAAARLRPGAAVRARFRTVGAPIPGFEVPRAAIVRIAGKSWVWVRVDAQSFERRELPLDRPLPDGWFTDLEWARESRVVVRGAQALLSAELLNAQGRTESEG